MQSQCWTEGPTAELQGQGNLGPEIEPRQNVSGMKTWLTARKARHRGVERPDEWRAPQFAVYAGGIDAGSVQDPNRIERRRIRQYAIWIRGLKEVLVALHHAADRETAHRLGKKNLRFYF